MTAKKPFTWHLCFLSLVAFLPFSCMLSSFCLISVNTWWSLIEFGVTAQSLLQILPTTKKRSSLFFLPNSSSLSLDEPKKNFSSSTLEDIFCFLPPSLFPPLFFLLYPGMWCHGSVCVSPNGAITARSSVWFVDQNNGKKKKTYTQISSLCLFSFMNVSPGWPVVSCAFSSPSFVYCESGRFTWTMTLSPRCRTIPLLRGASKLSGLERFKSTIFNVWHTFFVSHEKCLSVHSPVRSLIHKRSFKQILSHPQRWRTLEQDKLFREYEVATFFSPKFFFFFQENLSFFKSHSF